MAITDERALEKLLAELDPGNVKTRAMLAKVEEELGVGLSDGEDETETLRTKRSSSNQGKSLS